MTKKEIIKAFEESTHRLGRQGGEMVSEKASDYLLPPEESGDE